MAVCENPYSVGSIPARCGTCYSCRVYRGKVWSHRIMLEALQHEFNSFITLTYDEKNNPTEVRKDHIRGFIKKLREKIYPRKLRYYCVGEYGENTKRPHYHGALFGISFLEKKTIDDSWDFGNTAIYELSDKSASYVAGYVTKKLVKEGDSCEKAKEFQIMSLKPGIGAVSMDAVSQAIKKLEDTSKFWKGDVPMFLRHSQSIWPLGRYLRRKIREKIGRSQDTPKSILEEYSKEMSGLYRDYIENSENEEEERFKKLLKKSELFVDINKQKILNFKNRRKIYSMRGIL